jgi:hypothetical protein
MYLREVPRPYTANASSRFGAYLGHLPRQARAAQGPRCPRLPTQARNFRERITLVRTAATRLTACGFVSVGDRMHVVP